MFSIVGPAIEKGLDPIFVLTLGVQRITGSGVRRCHGFLAGVSTMDRPGLG